MLLNTQKTYFTNHRRRVFVLSAGLILGDSKRGPGPCTRGKFLKLVALKLHFQHSENTFGEIFYIFIKKTH